MVGIVTFISFIILASVPLFVYIIDYFWTLNINLILWASIMTLVAFGIIGYLKGIVNHKNKWFSTINTVLIGGLAALVAYVVGYILEGIIIQ